MVILNKCIYSEQWKNNCQIFVTWQKKVFEKSWKKKIHNVNLRKNVLNFENFANF